MVPKCLTVVLCDSVRRPEYRGDPTVVRSFEAFEVASFPAITRPFSVWLEITDGNGQTGMELLVEYIPPDTIEPERIVLVPFTLDFRNPNDVVRYEAHFANGIELERMGRYRLRLMADGATIAQRYFVALRTA